MSQERFQSETGQTIDDNCCSLLFGNTSPLFYTVNPRSGISLRQQEQLGAPSILKSFRDLPGCTRLSTSLTNLDSSSRRAQFPLLPDISHKGNMGKSLQGHHSSGKRFVRERYNPPFKVNAKIRHVYTQEVTTIEQGPDPPNPNHHQQNHHGHRNSSNQHHYYHGHGLRNSHSVHDVVTCHRQTQTEPSAQLFPGEGDLKQKPEVESEHANSELKGTAPDHNRDNAGHEKTVEKVEIIEEKMEALSRTNLESKQQKREEVTFEETETESRKVDASTSPIPSPFYSDSGESSANPFSGCSQMTVYPPLNYVRKLEDLEKITGHIVIQRFFTKTDDAFGTWLERQLGMTTKSVSVDTSEFENAKTVELQDVEEKIENDDGVQMDSGIDTASSGDIDAGNAIESVESSCPMEANQINEMENSTTQIIVANKENEDENATPGVEELVPKNGYITGNVSDPGDGDILNTETSKPAEENLCGVTDSVRCECYKQNAEISANEEIEEQIIPENVDVSNSADGAELKSINEPETNLSVKDSENVEVINTTDVAELKPIEESEHLMLAALPTLATTPEVVNNKTSNGNDLKSCKNEEDIDEVVRCTLEAYLMAPLEFEDINEDEELEKNKMNTAESLASPVSVITAKSEVDSGRADSIQSQDNSRSFETLVDTEGNTTSHDSVETVYEIPIASPKTMDLDNVPSRVLQRCLSADSCIGTESSGDAKNPTTNASQSSNDTIEVIEPVIMSKEAADVNVSLPSSAPLTSARSQTTKLPAIPSAKSIKHAKLIRSLSTCQSQRSVSPGSAGAIGGAIGSGKIRGSRRPLKTDVEAEDADGESETESEITDNQYVLSGRRSKHQPEGTDLELEEVEEDDGDDDDRDAFDKMVANHLKYSRGLTATANSRRSRLNRGTQTTKSIEPSTTSGSLSPCSSSNSSFDVEIISKSKRITTASTTGGGGLENDLHHDMITPSNMTLAWHEGGRRRSYLPSGSSSLNLLNMKFSLGKDFESEVSIRMPATNKSPVLTNNNSANIGSASILLPGSGGTTGKTPLTSSSGRTHHLHYHSHLPNRGLSSSSQHSHSQQHSNNQQTLQSPLTSATSTTLQMMSEPRTVPNSDLQSLWKDVRTKLDVQVDNISATVIPEEDDIEGLQVRGNGLLGADPAPSSASSMVKLRRNEEKIKRSLQRLKKILDE